MNDLARTKLVDIVNSYGRTVCNTPRTCEIFLQQHCDDLPAERQLLGEALRRGTVSRLVEAKDQPYAAISAALVSELASAADIAPEDARWAVDSWALALGKHPSTATPPPLPIAPLLVEADAQESQCSVTSSKFWPPAIVGLGGGIGAILATLVFTFLLYTLISNPRGTTGIRADAFAMLAGLLMAGAGALGGATGGAVGWLLIQAQSLPAQSAAIARWRLARGFLAACGGAFGASLLGGWFGGLVGIALGGLVGSFSASVVSGLKG